jgi:glycoside/pentoside/hexuronide:cation symporter, GPH family
MILSKPLPRRLLGIFAMPAFMLGFMHAPEAMMQGIYAKHAGLPLGALALALIFTRGFDGLTYPLIGYLSDLTARRHGRKPWLIAGTVVTVTGLWFLYRPPPDVSIYYFTGWFMVTYLGWKMTEIPYIAWSFALSHDYAERARIQTWRAMVQMIGIIAFYIVPYLAAAQGLSPTTELDFNSLGLVAVMIVILVPVMNLTTVWVVPDGDTGASTVRRAHVGMREVWRSMSRNRPLLRFLTAFILMTVLYGMATGAAYLFVDVYMGFGKQLAGILLVATVVQILSVPVWGRLCQRLERHRVLAAAWFGAAAFYGAIGFLPPGSGSLTVFAVLYTLGGLGFGAFYVVAPAILGDISDHGRVTFGEDHAGLYSSVFYFVMKSIGGVSVGLGVAVIGWFGFDATSTTGQSPTGQLGIRLISAWLPAIGLGSAAALLWRFPLDRAAIQRNASLLEQQRSAAPATQAAQPATS